MENKFYSEFDFERLKESGFDDYRTPFQVDRDRVIHSSEFRRLQGKTQVFLPGMYDYYRTRLTHSIEVAQIGRSICNYLLKKQSDIFSKDYYIDPDVVETACLSHDLGNPPFGHSCEKRLNEMMRPYGGYEGNAQTLRLLTEIFYRKDNGRRGMNPTRATLDGVLKYKALYSQFENPKNHFIYDSQKKYLDFVFAGRDLPAELNDPKKINKFKSIECQIMDWADDTAYSTNDVVDSVLGGFIQGNKLVRWGEKNSDSLSEYQIKLLEQIIGWIQDGSFKRNFSGQIGNFISACKIVERDTFMNDLTNRHKYELVVDKEILEKVKLYKRISVELVFQSAVLHQMEFKGNSIITKLFELMIENYITIESDEKLLPDFADQVVRNEEDESMRARMICDYISGMTDSYALRTYKRLFDPDYSSLADLI